MVRVARSAGPGASLFRVPVLRRGAGHRATRPLPVGSAGPPGASKQARLYARYLTAVHYVDSLVGGVLDDLKRRKLFDHTVVIVTSDHGMEFNENGLGFIGHGTAFSDLQLRTPLVVRWPGRPLAASIAAPPTTTSRRRSSPSCSAARIRPPITRAGTVSFPTRSGTGSSPPATKTLP